MSVLNQPYATPSRLKGIYRLLLEEKEQKIDRSILEETLSPKSLQPDVDHTKYEHLKMIHPVVSEAIKMGLVQENEGNILFSNEIPTELLTDDKLALICVLLFSNEENQENVDLLRLLTWYMMQDPYSAPGNWDEANLTLQKQIGENTLGCNDVRFGQFTYWLGFLGFGWKYSFKGEKSRFVPDPSHVIHSLLPLLFKKQPVLRITEFGQKLSEICPVFEGGKIRNELNKKYKVESLEVKHLSKVTSYALLKLQEKGYIKLDHKSDAENFFLSDGERSQRCSEIRWLENREVN